MSWSTCYSGSNNIHFQYPPLMSDGRHFINMDPTCRANTFLRNENNINNNYDYRQFLINNAKKIINTNTGEAFRSCGYNSNNNNPSLLTTNNKYLYKNINDKSIPYGYEHSNLKNLYLSRQQLQAKNIAPILTQEQLLILRSRK